MRVVGLMSGTSFDAIDVAVVDFRLDGGTLRLTPLGTIAVDYPAELRAAIGAVLPPAAATIEAVCHLHTRIGQAHAEAADRGLAELAGGRADLVVSPGQTVYHWVDGGRALGTLQLGAPAWVARRTGLPVLSDLRSADIAEGGQGAPLVPIFDVLLLGGARVARAALNLGGIANLTSVRPDGTVTGYDIGPANALLDAAARRLLGQDCDLDGRHAATGRVDRDLLDDLLAEPYYARRPPKSTGKELFHDRYLADRLRPGIRAADVLATLTELTARTVADALDAERVAEVYASGGGVRNPTLLGRLSEIGAGRWRLAGTDELGVPAQAKEAYAFALLGWLSWHGLPGAVPSVTGAARPAVLGSFSPGADPLCLPTPAVRLPDRLLIDQRLPGGGFPGITAVTRVSDR